MLSQWSAKRVFGITFLVAMLVPMVACAADIAPAHNESTVEMARAFAAALAMGLCGLGAGYAQAKIGSAGAGTLAERPEVSVWVITLQALPEIIALLGFVSAILING